MRRMLIWLLTGRGMVAMVAAKAQKTEKEYRDERLGRVMDGVACWASYYRANIHRFCADYLGLHLKLFQKILIYMMNESTNFMYVAARGQGKTFLVAVFCVARCILYPGTRICIASKSRKQAFEIINKITTILMPASGNLRSEIKDVSASQHDRHVSFHNHSWIIVVTANDNARGNRANVLIVDEFRMVDANIINMVLRKFLTAPRHPGYLEKPAYAHMVERNKEIYLTSAWFQSHWSYEKLKTYCANLLDASRKYFVCGLPYQLSIAENLLSKEQVEDEMSEADFQEISFGMEMGCLWFSDREGSFYSYDDISKTRKIRYGMYPSSIAMKIQDRRARVVPRMDGERRILSADIALMSSKQRNNDASSIFINQVARAQNGRFVNNIIYTENHEGLLTDHLALIIRRLFQEFECTDLVVDCKGIGFGVLEFLLKDMYDPESGETYGALSCRNNEEIAARCGSASAPKVVWAINNQTAKFNSDCALGLREAFKQGKVRLLASEFSIDEELCELRGYASLPLEDKLEFQMPYIHTGLLVNELVNLSYEARDTLVRVKERPGARKDRYSSLSYNLWASRQLEEEMSRPRGAFDPAALLAMGRKAKLYD